MMLFKSVSSNIILSSIAFVSITQNVQNQFPFTIQDANVNHKTADNEEPVVRHIDVNAPTCA